MFQHESRQEWRVVAVRVLIFVAIGFLVPLLSTLFLRKKQTGQVAPSAIENATTTQLKAARATKKQQDDKRLMTAALRREVMTPANFAAKWNEPLVKSPLKKLRDLQLPAEAKDFLSSAGLPKEAAPFLSFDDLAVLETVEQAYELSEDFRRYRIIGSTGSGDPICLDEVVNGEVVYLNHDKRFQRVFVNASIPQLAESLLAFRHLGRQTMAKNGEDAFIDGDIPEHLKTWITQELKRIDSKALDKECFWNEMLSEFNCDT